MLEQIFLKVLYMSRMASIIIVVVFVIRMLLKRFPKYLSYMLWSVVLFRLLCPFTLESGISPVPNLEPVFYEYTSGKADVSAGRLGEPVNPGTDREGENIPENGQRPSGQITPGTGASAQFRSNAESGNAEVNTVEVSGQERFLLYGKYVWLAGIGVLFLYCVISAVRICRNVSASIPLKANIYITDQAVSPFVMGIFNPRIYLPGCLSGEEQEYIILHERVHIRRFDHIVKPAAFAALCIHWFNPLVWIAFRLFCKDMEMSCDEAVIKRMGEHIRADYSASLLALSTQRRINWGIPVDFGEGDTRGRVKNLAAFRKTKKGVAAVLIIGVITLIACLASTRKPVFPDAESPIDDISSDIGNGINDEINDERNGAENGEIPDQADESEKTERLQVTVDITEHYVTRKGNSSNLYYIDENRVLWGCGRNEYGQLGQGTRDNDFHENMVKIAENVLHVDFSQSGFVIFLTEDRRLYGMGNAAGGALQQYAAADWSNGKNADCYVSEPYLLAVNAAYACCGDEDIVCLKEDGTVWTWGSVYHGYFIASPKKIFESAVFVTGGAYHHAALLPNGTVWTWGNNSTGNCGVADLGLVSEPTMVAEDVVMVWTDLTVDGYLELDAENLFKAWTGKLKYTEYDTIAEYGGWYPRFLHNTVIQKSDGSYWVCGENVGTEEKLIHGVEGDYSVICTHEFYPCE